MFKPGIERLLFEIIAAIVVVILCYIINEYRKNKKAGQYKNLAPSLRLNYVEGEFEWEKIYGEQSSLLLPGTKEKFIYNRMSGLFAGSATGEFCEMRGKILSHKGSGDFVMEYRSRRGTNIKFDGDEYDEFIYSCAVFKLNSGNIPDFNVDYSSLVDLRNMGMQVKGNLGKVLNPMAVNAILSFPQVSVACGGGILLFYSNAVTPDNIRDFLRFSSEAAAHIIR